MNNVIITCIGLMSIINNPISVNNYKEIGYYGLFARNRRSVKSF